MSGILPDAVSGGVIIRDAAGNCTTPPNVVNSYCPPAAFVTSCEVTALPSDCTARITPAQINALVSELMSLAECWDPNGPWDCAAVTNLCSAFTEWAALNVMNVIISDTAPTPVNLKHGQLWYESDSGNTYIYYDDGNSAQWVQIAPGATSLSTVIISDTAPANPAVGTLWYESDSGVISIWYDDGNSQQWVMVAPGTGGGGGGITTTGVPEAPNDGRQYGRQNQSWTPVTSSGTGLPPGGTPGQVLMIDATSVASWNATIDGGVF